ncbi:hypothetical protein SAMN04488515_2362 [Cognatiyoonia koreensis]|uniref:Pentapeptide repeat-containing protein n=1 Tax=Cognatiyoonia koreensis TaxID=364200 RepID=A0A1I0QYE0_9RHOB|nr:hypothetical protein [Cognatiyoonia koreensis]SEW32881.1 hypothetical protein SAMN04488515_2362 [Cognatiyoonia koreensis]
MTILKDANKNAWYILMTMHGEQLDAEIDWELHARNRQTWNSWASQGLQPKQCKLISARNRLSVHDTGKVDLPQLQIQFNREWHKRNGPDSIPPAIPNSEEVINLRNVRFKHHVVFDKFIVRILSFARSVFEKTANFDRAYFCDRARFYEVNFQEETSFYRANFLDRAVFERANFHKNVSFQNVTFEAVTVFSRAIFGVSDRDIACRADFSGTRFDAVSFFDGAKFTSHFPVLNGANLHEITTFTAHESYWPKEHTDWEILKSRLRRANVNTDKAALQDAFEGKISASKLRHTMARQSFPESEHFFYRRELAFSKHIGSVTQRMLHYAFDWFSSYGNSIGRPLFYLAVLFALGGGMLFAELLDSYSTRDAAALSLATSFSNLLPIFGFGRTFLKEVLEALSPTMQFVSGIQTVAALPLLFFLALGLRTRFRLR